MALPGGANRTKLLHAVSAAAAEAVRWEGSSLARSVVLASVAGLSKLWTSVLNSPMVVNKERLLQAVINRPPGTPLLTASNHTCTIDDPLQWGLWGLPADSARLARWTLAAEDICFTNALHAYFFRLGKCIPCRRGAGIHHEYVLEALHRLEQGDWVHMFPEGGLVHGGSSLRRLKWGLASLIVRCTTAPLVLPVCHSGFDKVLPEHTWPWNKRAWVPRIGQRIALVVGEPLEFDLPQLRREAAPAVQRCRAAGQPFPWQQRVPKDRSPQEQKQPTASDALLAAMLEDDETKWLYSSISELIRERMQDLTLQAQQLAGADNSS